MPSRSTLLSNYSVLHSRDPELVRDRLCRGFGATSLDIAGQDEFVARVNHLQVRGLGLSYCDYTGDVSLWFGEAFFVRQIFNISGSGRYKAGDCFGEITPGSWSPVLSAPIPDIRGRIAELLSRRSRK